MKVLVIPPGRVPARWAHIADADQLAGLYELLECDTVEQITPLRSEDIQTPSGGWVDVLADEDGIAAELTPNHAAGDWLWLGQAFPLGTVVVLGYDPKTGDWTHLATDQLPRKLLRVLDEAGKLPSAYVTP